jgi:hypothetical protein
MSLVTASRYRPHAKGVRWFDRVGRGGGNGGSKWRQVVEKGGKGSKVGN